MKIYSLCFLFLLSTLTACNGLRDVSPTASDDGLEGCNVTSTQFGAGDGTVAKPYLICNNDQLLNVASNLSSNFKLVKDLDLTGFSLNPIGADDTTGFTGTFDGNSKKISNWTYINATDGHAVGLFRRVSAGGVVKNLTLKSAHLEGNAYVGGVVGLLYGYASHITIDGGVFKGQATVGGVAGRLLGTLSGNDKTIDYASVSNATIFSYANNSAFCDCAVGGIVGVAGGGGADGADGKVIHSTASNNAVTWDSAGTYQVFYMVYAGGIVGFLFGNTTALTVDDCFTIGGTVTGVGAVGGVVGAVDGATVKDSGSTATIVGVTAVGGVAGIAHGTLLRTYSTGSVSGTDHVGGVCGYHYANGITESFSTGTVTGTGSNTGGIVGYNAVGYASTTVTDCYSLGNVVGSTNAGGAFGKSDEGVSSKLYSTGTVTGTAPKGSIGSYAAGTGSVTQNFFNNVTGPADANGSGLDGTQILAQGSYTGFDFTVGTGKWRMPSANPGHALTPVLAWQCGKNGVTCL